MQGLLGRLIAILKAKFSAGLDRAENPGESLDYSLERQRDLLRNVQRGVADVVTAKKRLQLQMDELRGKGTKLESQARDAMAAGREDLARKALERKAVAEQQIESLGEQVRDLETQQEKLVRSEQQLKAKVDAFRSEKEVIKAEHSAAEAQVRITEAATGLSREMEDTGRAIERAREKTRQLEARASALDELVESGTLEDFTSPDTQLDRELAEIAASKRVDQELEQLRAEVGAGGPKQLGA